MNGSVNGQRTSYTSYTLDGISIDDDSFRGSTLSSLSGNLLLDQAGEMTVAGILVRPEFGVRIEHLGE